LRQQQASGAYAKTSLLADFLSALEQDLGKVTDDKHAYVIPTKDRRPDIFVLDSLTPDEREKLVRKSAYTNNGFYKLERLDGNLADRFAAATCNSRERHILRHAGGPQSTQLLTVRWRRSPMCNPIRPRRIETP